MAPRGRAGRHAARSQRPRIGVVKFASCDGCQLTLLDLEDELLDDRRAVRPRRVRRGDVAPIGRPVRRPARRGLDQHARAGRGDRPAARRDAAAGHDRRVRHGRRHPGPPQLVRPRRRSGPRSTRSPDYVESLATATPVADFVAVDAELRGCPISPGQLLELLTALRVGRRPQLPDEAVCLECKRRGIVCVAVAAGRALPRAGDADGLRRAVPGLRRAAATAASARASRPTRRALRAWLERDGDRRRGRPPLRRLHGLVPAVPRASSTRRGGPPGRADDRRTTPDA